MPDRQLGWRVASEAHLISEDNMHLHKDNAPSGLLVVDKPRGPTSHDVVARIRRIIGTKSVGHAGTLDPMATGVLIVLVGQCTKLSGYLSNEDKVYDATIELGRGTDTLDADGAITDVASLTSSLVSELYQIQCGIEPSGERLLHNAISAERHRVSQMPPAYSAIKLDGRAAYARARRGEPVVLDPREVRVERMTISGATTEPPSIRLELRVSKGYYVRSLARDLGMALGVPAHLTELRRLRSGSVGLDRAVGLDCGSDAMLRSMMTVEEVAGLLFPSRVLTERGVYRARCGQQMSDDDFDSPPPSTVSAWYSLASAKDADAGTPVGGGARSGCVLVAVGDRSRGWPAVLRVFVGR